MLKTEEIPLKKELSKLYTPIDFELTQVIDTKPGGSTGQPDPQTSRIALEKRLMELSEELKLAKFSNKALPADSTVGLKNVAENCFANCVLQVLVNERSFQHHLREIVELGQFEPNLRFSLIGFFGKIFDLCYAREKLKFIAPRSLLSNLEVINPRFKYSKPEQISQIFNFFGSTTNKLTRFDSHIVQVIQTNPKKPTFYPSFTQKLQQKIPKNRPKMTKNRANHLP